MENNIIYKTEKIADYFSHNRIKWDQFYESERRIISQLNISQAHSILDIGCGCGGLGLALKEKFNSIHYTGVEINDQAAEKARSINKNAQILSGDILEVSKYELELQDFDVVFSLSCIDWNVQFMKSLTAAWKHVKPGGSLVATFRCTDLVGINDIKESYQYINYEGVLEGELASYVVININVLLNTLREFNPSQINAFGYWGKPSVTAITPFKNICFSAFSIKKQFEGKNEKTVYDLNLPGDLVDQIVII